MTPAEAQTLLTIAAAFDNRKPDADAAQAWSMALDGLRFIDCREAIVAHYRRSPEWLMPSMVVSGVKRLREKRLTATLEPDPPGDLNPAETIAWLADVRRQIADGEYVAPEPPVLPRREVAELGLRKGDLRVNGAPRPPALVPACLSDHTTTQGATDE